MSLKINGLTGASRGASASGAGRASGDFSLKGAGAARSAAAPAAVSASVSLSGIDAILALQGEEDVLTGRRRRQVNRAQGLLDTLDEIKVSLLGGEIADAALLSLQKRIEAQREAVEDPRLQEVLDEIETRAFVELAKRRLI